MLHVNVRAIVERETPAGVEVLLQVRDRAGEPRTLELPGGRLDMNKAVYKTLDDRRASVSGSIRARWPRSAAAAASADPAVRCRRICA